MANETIISKKAEEVAAITEKMNEAKSVIVVDYRGLTVAEVTELRRSLREEGVEMHVYKNNLVRRASKEVGVPELEEHLAGPNATLFAMEESTAAARVAYEFAKKHENLELKGGIMENEYVDVDTVKELAALPGRDGMYSMLLSVLQAPIRNLALVAKAVAEQQPAE